MTPYHAIAYSSRHGPSHTESPPNYHSRALLRIRHPTVLLPGRGGVGRAIMPLHAHEEKEGSTIITESLRIRHSSLAGGLSVGKQGWVGWWAGQGRAGPSTRPFT